MPSTKDTHGWRPIDNFVLSQGGMWQVICRHPDGGYEVAIAEPRYGEEFWTSRDLRWHDRWDLIPSEYVIACCPMPALAPLPSADVIAAFSEGTSHE